MVTRRGDTMINRVSNFKDRFNQALEIRNILPVDLSKRTKISEATISQYRSGYAKPKEEKLAIISNALNVNPAWLMGLDVSMELHQAKFDLTDNKILIELDKQNFTDEQMESVKHFLDLYLKLPPEKQTAIENLLK